MPRHEDTHIPEIGRGDATFATTRWSVVAAAHGDGPAATAALATLCELYWEPVYVYLRRSGHCPDDAADLTQGFFARLLEKRGLRGADPQRGCFRAFLLGAVKHFLANERDKAHALKRGGGVPHLELDATSAEDRYRCEPPAAGTPETAFHRRWALGMLAQTLDRLAERYREEGKEALFDELAPHLSSDAQTVSCAESARRLAMTENAVKVAAHRLRRRYRDTLRAAVADTVNDPAAIDDEIRFLIAAVGQ